MNLKQRYNIVFQPKDRRFTKRKKFMISINRLADYVGKSNSEKIIFLIENSLEEKFILKFRKYGKLWIYAK